MRSIHLIIFTVLLFASNVYSWDLTYYAVDLTFVKALEFPTTTSSATTTSQTPASQTPGTSSFSGYFNSTTSSTSASSTSSTDLSAFASLILQEHNSKRALHGSPALTWNSDLADFAQDYIDNGNDACQGNLEHSGQYYGKATGYGENLALGYTYTGAVDAWYDEIKNYNWDDPEGGSTGEIGHFTQVVWNTTLELGCAYKYCNAVWSNYIVCEYSPPGNYIGTYKEHVPPLLT